MDSELTRLRKLRAEENLELIRLKQKASRDTNPLHRQIIPIRERSLSRLDRSLEHIESAKRANANSQARTAELFAYLDHARRTVSLQDSSWDNFYRGQLLSLRAEARVSCPDVFEKHYGAIEPAQ